MVNVCHEEKILFNEISSDTQDFSAALFSCERVLERAREQGGILRARAEVVLCTCEKTFIFLVLCYQQ